jgi:integrase
LQERFKQRISPQQRLAVIAVWLGHESIETTNVYVHANLAMKEKALAFLEAL